MPAVQGGSANYGRREVYGPFHRRLSDTQDAEAVRRQVLSGELWGRVPRWGSRPAVKAYPGPLPESMPGVEFWALQEPDRAVGPRSHWSSAGPSVVIDGSSETAKLSVVFARVTQELIP